MIINCLQMLRKRKRAIGSDDFVTVDFNPRKSQHPLSKSHVVTTHLVHQYAAFLRNSNVLFHFLRGLKSTVTTSVEPTVLLNIVSFYSSKNPFSNVF